MSVIVSVTFELEDFSDDKIDAILQMDFDEFIEWQMLDNPMTKPVAAL